jgi:MoaA/NifB/PqqE/SkfB family radical SAM enzyme
MKYVIDLALHYHIDIRIGIYGTMAFFDTTSELLTASDFVPQIPQNILHTQENFDFIALYNEWRNGHLQLRCQSIISSLVIHSNGDVPLCQNLDVTLGNIHAQTLDEIFNSKQTQETQCHYSQHCNGCWINFHRKYDIILMRNLERLLPKWFIEHFYGKYQWTADSSKTYREHFKELPS